MNVHRAAQSLLASPLPQFRSLRVFVPSPRENSEAFSGEDEEQRSERGFPLAGKQGMRSLGLRVSVPSPRETSKAFTGEDEEQRSERFPLAGNMGCGVDELVVKGRIPVRPSPCHTVGRGDHMRPNGTPLRMYCTPDLWARSTCLQRENASTPGDAGLSRNPQFLFRRR